MAQKTELQELKEQYPNADYQDGFFYPDKDSDNYLTINASNADPINADHIIQDHFYWAENLAGTGVDADTFIRNNFEDYEAAFKSV